MKLKCVHLSMKSKCVPWWMTSLWKLKKCVPPWSVVLGWGLCGELGTHISSLQFSKFDVRGDVPGGPAVCGVASRSPESARRAARADIARRKCRDGEPCGVQHPTVPVSRGDHKGHYLPTSSQQGCNCYRVCACVSRLGWWGWGPTIILIQSTDNHTKRSKRRGRSRRPRARMPCTLILS